MNATALGEHVVYTPRERGPHLIYVTYGGLDVPGSTASVLPRTFNVPRLSGFDDGNT